MSELVIIFISFCLGAIVSVWLTRNSSRDKEMYDKLIKIQQMVKPLSELSSATVSKIGETLRKCDSNRQTCSDLQNRIIKLEENLEMIITEANKKKSKSKE